MATTRFADHLLTGIHSARPSASAVPAGTLYSCTTHGLIYQSDGSSAWSTYATLGGTETLPVTIIDAKGDVIAGTAADTAARLAVGADGTVLTAASGQTTGLQWASPAGGGAWTLLSTTTLGSDGPIDVSSISGSYNDLFLVLIGRLSGAGGAENSKWLLNNDTGSNYNREMISVNSTTAVSGVETAGTVGFSAGQLVGGGAASGLFSFQQLTILGYASTTWKKGVVWDCFHATATGAGQQTTVKGGGWWNSTAAITRVSVAGATTTNLVTGSVLRIYGRL